VEVWRLSSGALLESVFRTWRAGGVSCSWGETLAGRRWELWGRCTVWGKCWGILLCLKRKHGTCTDWGERLCVFYPFSICTSHGHHETQSLSPQTVHVPWFLFRHSNIPQPLPHTVHLPHSSHLRPANVSPHEQFTPPPPLQVWNTDIAGFVPPIFELVSKCLTTKPPSCGDTVFSDYLTELYEKYRNYLECHV